MIVPEIRGGATVMDGIFDDEEDDTAEAMKNARPDRLLSIERRSDKSVELRGFEPLPVPAKIGSELGRMFDHGVTRPPLWPHIGRMYAVLGLRLWRRLCSRTGADFGCCGMTLKCL